MMEEDRNTVQYHLGLLTSKVESLGDSVDSLTDTVGKNVALTVRVAETIERLPCKERLESCKRERDSILKRITNNVHNNHHAQQSRSTSQWAAGAAIGGGLLVAAIQAIVHFFWR